MKIQELNNFVSNLKQPYVIILVGPPLSGKDTLLKQMDLSETVVVSRDQIVLDVWGSDNYDESFKNVNQKEVDARLSNQLKDSCMNKKNTIVNMTNMIKKRRISNLNYFSDDYYKIALVFPILDDSEYIKRNSKRKKEEKKWIPPFVLKQMIQNWEDVTFDEGFDKILYV